MEQVFMGLVLLLLVLDLAVTAGLYFRMCLPSREERNERAVERAMEQEAADPIDEGFENIMRFSVNGKTGFETE